MLIRSLADSSAEERADRVYVRSANHQRGAR